MATAPIPAKKPHPVSAALCPAELPTAAEGSRLSGRVESRDGQSLAAPATADPLLPPRERLTPGFLLLDHERLPEAGGGVRSYCAELAEATGRVCGRLRQQFAPLVGDDTCAMLLGRAVSYTTTRYPSLHGVRWQPESDPRLEGLAEGLEAGPPEEARRACAEILDASLSLLFQFLGPELTCRQLRREWPELAAAIVAIAENVHREDLSEIDKAAALLRLKTLTDQTWDQVAELVKLSPDYVKRLAGLLKLEPFVQEMLRSGQVSVRTAIALRPLPACQQIEMAERVIAEGLTAEQVRKAVHRRKTGHRRAAAAHTEESAAGVELPRIAGSGSVAERLHDCADALQEIDSWLGGRDWPPSRVTAAQQEALERLYIAANRLQQHLLSIRTQEDVWSRN